MVEDFKVILEILKGEPKEIGMDPTATVSKALNTPEGNPQVFQLSFMDTLGTAAVLSAQADTSAVNVEVASFLEQLA